MANRSAVETYHHSHPEVRGRRQVTRSLSEKPRTAILVVPPGGWIIIVLNSRPLGGLPTRVAA